MNKVTLSPMSFRMIAVILGATVGNFLCLTQTVMNVLGVLLIPISQQFGWSRTAVAGAFTAMALSSGMMMPFAGRIADRFGVRRVLLIGFTLFGFCILLLALLPPQKIAFYGLFALVGATGSVPSTMLFSKLLAQWFDKNRGFWLGMTDGAGNGLGAAILPSIAVMLLNAFGWRGAFIGAGTAVLLVGLPIGFFTWHSPTNRLDINEDGEDALGMTLDQALRTGTFWMVLIAVAFGGGVLLSVFLSIMPILTDRGLTMAQAAAVIAAFSLVGVLWEPLAGFIMDRTDRPRAVASFFLLTAVGLIILAFAHNFYGLMFGAMLTCVGMATDFSVLPLLLSRYFGLRAMGAISGIAYSTVLVSNAFGPLVINRMFDVTGGYSLALEVISVMMVCAAAIFFFLKRFPTSWTAEPAAMARSA